MSQCFTLMLISHTIGLTKECKGHWDRQWYLTEGECDVSLSSVECVCILVGAGCDSGGYQTRASYDPSQQLSIAILIY